MAVRLETQDGIGHIVLDRPPANSYDRAFMEELDAAIESARSADAIKAIVVRSASEKFFSAGADVSVFAKSDLDTQNAFVVCANEAMTKFETTPKVIIAAINGHCLGGGLEIALCCDFR
ncbi:MAG TPA: enoyl-CoA hydratase/isomerase family protein, partial [Candidatus Limnocylindria bacterium]